MWKRLFIALFCALLGYGFSSSNPLMPGAPVVNPPGGINNYLPINNPTWTGAGAGTTLNLTGATPALTFNGVPIGGSCTGSDFINAISASGVISCATPAGGGGGLPTPVSVANGGLGQGNAPTAGQILVAASGTVYDPVTMSGNGTISTTGVLSITSYTGPNLNLTGALTFNGNAVGGACPAGQLMNSLSASLVPGCVTISSGNGIIVTAGTISLASPVTVANGGLGQNAFPPTAGQVIIALNPTNYIPRTITGDLTISSTGVAAVVSVGGVAGPFAPQTNPAGGQNNYAPLANPSFSGTITFPNGSIADAALASAYSGVGACPASEFVTGLTRNAAPTCAFPPGAGSFAPITNPTGGQNNYAAISSPTFTGAVSIPNLTVTATITLPAASITDANLANAYSGVGACAAGSVATTLTRNAAPTCSTMATLGGGLFAPLTNPANGQNNYAPLASPTFTGTVTVPNLTTGTATTWTFPDGSTYTNAGHNNMLALGIGAPAPTLAGNFRALLVATANGNFDTSINVTNSTAGTNADSALRLVNNVVGSGGWILMTSSTFTASGNMPGDALQIGSAGANGMVFATSTTINPAPPIRFWAGNNQTAIIDSTGLTVSVGGIGIGTPAPARPGMLSMVDNANGNTSVSLSNNDPGTNSSTSIYVGNGPHYGAMQLNGTGGNPNGFAPDTFALLSDASAGIAIGVDAGEPIRFYSSTLVPQGQFSTNGFDATHLDNLFSSGVPQLVNGTLRAGSRDTFGWILGNGNWPVIMTFSRPFVGTASCVATVGTGGAATIFTGSEVPQGIQFGCFTPGGATCGQAWFQYICFGLS